MDGKLLQERVKAIKAEIFAIQESEAVYRHRASHSPIDKAAHQARREALETIKVELAFLSERKSQ